MNLLKNLLVISAIFFVTLGHSLDLTGYVAKAVIDFIPSVPVNAKNGSTIDSSIPNLPKPTGHFGGCREIFVNGNPPVVSPSIDNSSRALCFNGFAVLHSAKTKTPIYSAEVLSRQRILDAKGEQRSNKFFSDARLPSAERATLKDYSGSDLDRGHMSPAGDMDNSDAMAQSFSLANMIPQAPRNNRESWAGIESATRKYVLRAAGNVYVITGPVSVPGVCFISHLSSCVIGNGVVVPSHIFKLVYDAETKRAWAHWIENSDTARASAPISYSELVKRTGIEFFPGIQVKS